MNVAWCFEWFAMVAEIESILKQYNEIMEPEFYNPETCDDPLIATMWLARNEILNISVDLVRELYWQDLSKRYKGEQ